MAAPIAVGPDTRWRPQSNAACPADVGGDVGHGVVPEDELSCLLSLLSAVTEPSELTLGAVGKLKYTPDCPPGPPVQGWNNICETAR